MEFLAPWAEARQQILNDLRWIDAVPVESQQVFVASWIEMDRKVLQKMLKVLTFSPDG